MTQTENIFIKLKIGFDEIKDLRVYDIKNENIRESLSKFQNHFENLYFYYKDQVIIEKMISDIEIINAVKEIKKSYAEYSYSEPLRLKLIELMNDNKIDYSIFPDTKVTDQLLKAIN